MAQNAWINEVHYDNTGGDVNEMIEVVVENASSYNLANLKIHLYNGNDGSVYDTDSIAGFTLGNIVGNFTIFYLIYPVNGVQNGAPDGMALSYNNVLIPGQFLSYEGTLVGTTGPAAGQTSVDIGVAELGTDPAGKSLQLSGTGTLYTNFTWQLPATSTAGSLNNNQTFSGFTPDPEPTNYPTGFSATSTGLSITLTWTDATGTQVPAAYLILASSSPNFTPPADQIPVADDINLKDGSGAKNVLQGAQTYTFSGLNGNTPYYFKIYPYTNSGSFINYKADASAPGTSAVTSTIIESINFNDSTFGNWDTISLASNMNWFIDVFAPDTFAKISGFQGNVPSDDWLISPPLFLDNYLNEMLSFRTAKNYTGPDLQVKISTNYVGGNPASATWTALTATVSPGSWAMTNSGNIDLSTYSGVAYIAFQYTSTSTESSTWELDDVAVTGMPSSSANPVINEFLADNVAAYQDPSDNSYDDWIELYNPSGAAISMNDWYLTNAILDTTKWQFPDTAIQANAYLIIWADNDSDPGLHTNFSLSKPGDAIYLFNPAKQLIDSVVFGQQRTDTTYARIPNGFGNFTFAMPTPMAFNQLYPIVVVDTFPPVATGAFGTAYDKIKVVFNEAVDTTAENIVNYTGLGSITSAIRIFHPRHSIANTGNPYGLRYRLYPDHCRCCGYQR